MAVDLLLGYVLLLVGFVFFANGLTVLGKTGAKEVGVLNFAVGVLILIAAWQLHGLEQTGATALVSVFALIYFMVAGIFIHGYDAKGLGWYAFFCWAWAVLVFICFLVFSLGKALAPLAAWLFIIEAFITLLIPGMLILTQKWTPVANFIAAQGG